jgi:hypothetical protein
LDDKQDNEKRRARGRAQLVRVRNFFILNFILSYKVEL